MKRYVAIVGGDGRHEQLAWPPQFEIRCFKAGEMPKVAKAAKAGKVGAVILATKFIKHSDQSVARGLPLDVYWRLWGGSFHSLTYELETLLKDVEFGEAPPNGDNGSDDWIERVNARVSTTAVAAAFEAVPTDRLVEQQVQILAGAALLPPLLPPAPPPLKETPMAILPSGYPPTFKAVPLNGYDRKARYIKPATSTEKGKWSPDYETAFVELAETGITDATEFCERLAERTGIYRFPGGLSLAMGPFMRLYTKIKPELRSALGMASRVLIHASRKYRENEAKLLKKGIEHLPERITAKATYKLVGDIKNRVKELDLMQDKQTTLYVYRKDEVLVLLDRLIVKGTVEARPVKAAPTRTPGTADRYNDLERDILTYVKDHPKSSMTAIFGGRSGSPRERETCKRLVDEGKLVCERDNRYGGFLHSLAPQKFNDGVATPTRNTVHRVSAPQSPTPGPFDEMKPNGEVVNTRSTPIVAPSAPDRGQAIRELLQMKAEGLLSAVDVAELLKKLT